MPRPSELPSYGSLFAPEQEILRRWLKLHEDEYERFEFNVRIGPGYDPGEQHLPEIRRMAMLNTQRRIDAIAHRGAEVTVIEVKRRGSLAALGQLAGYDHFWREDHPGDQPAKLLLIAGSLAEGTDAVANRMGILINLV